MYGWLGNCWLLEIKIKQEVSVKSLTNAQLDSQMANADSIEEFRVAWEQRYGPVSATSSSPSDPPDESDNTDEASREDIDDQPILHRVKQFPWKYIISVTPMEIKLRGVEADADKLFPIMTNNPDEERQFRRQHLYRHHDTGHMVQLSHDLAYYYCSCVQYDLPRSRLGRSPCAGVFHKGDVVVSISLWTNRQRGLSRTERWHRACWKATWRDLFIHYTSTQARYYENVALTVDSIVPAAAPVLAEPITRSPGRPGMAQTCKLSEVDMVHRRKLLNRLTTISHTLQSLEVLAAKQSLAGEANYVLTADAIARANAETEATKVTLATLGGVPKRFR